MSVTIVRADIGSVFGFVYVTIGQIYLVVNSKKQVDEDALEREARRIEQVRPTKSYLIGGEIGETKSSCYRIGGIVDGVMCGPGQRASQGL